MADMMQFDLVSPERLLASTEISAITIPGSEGEMTAMPGHSPLVSTLRPGVVSAKTASETLDYVVTGGLVEISPEGVSILAEDAIRRADFSREVADARIASAEAAIAQAGTEGGKVAARGRVEEIRALAARLGL